MPICYQRCAAHARSPWTSMRIAAIVGALLVSSVACSRPPRSEPVTLTFLDIEWDMSVRPLAHEDLQAFTRATGIQVKAIPRPDGSLNQLALWQELLQKGSAGPDVLGIDAIWSAVTDLIYSA